VYNLKSNWSWNFDIDDTSERVLKMAIEKIPEDKIHLWNLKYGVMPICTRDWRRTYLLDKKSKVGRTKKESTIRPLWIHPGYTARTIINRAYKTIIEKGLRNYTFLLVILHFDAVGGVVYSGKLKDETIRNCRNRK
jgi:hypothetical protein